MASRKLICAANHKLNGSKGSLKDFVDGFNAGFKNPEVEVIVAPPIIYLDFANSLKPKFDLASQNCHEQLSGAFTGETSIDMARETGAKWMILGHSERRHVFGEKDLQMTAKVAAVQKANLGAIICIGEKLEEREAGHTMDVCITQLEAFAKGISSWDSVVIAYEPVWAIGTGKTATPEMAQEVHGKIRNWLNEKLGKDKASTVRILYGGSVKPENAKELIVQPDIDGFLVGGASLKSNSFLSIIQSVASKSKL